MNVALHGTAYHVETQVRLYRQVKRREALEQKTTAMPTGSCPSRNGAALPNAPNARSRGNVEVICSANAADALHINARTAVPDWRGERMDHQLAVLELTQGE